MKTTNVKDIWLIILLLSNIIFSINGIMWSQNRTEEYNKLESQRKAWNSQIKELEAQNKANQQALENLKNKCK
jgi:hypothetical protein